MQAKHGSSLWSRRRSLIGCTIALVAMSAMMMPSIASAKSKSKSKPPVTSTFLALGDSLAFGYSTQLYNQGVVNGYENPEGFEGGYNNVYWNKTLKGEKKGVGLQNDGCPGETSASLIGTSLAKKLNEATPLKESQEKGESYPVTGESPCAYQEAWNAFKKVGTGGPLHHGYVGKTQLQDAITTIATKQNIEKQPVTTITLDIGNNDALHGVAGVEKEIEAKVKKIAEKEVQEKYIEPVVAEEVKAKYIVPAVEKYIQTTFIEPYLFVTFVKPHAEAECAEESEDIGGTPTGPEICASEYEKSGHTVEEAFESQYAGTEPGKKELKEKGEAYLAENYETGENFKHKGEIYGLEYLSSHKKELQEKGEVLGYEYFLEHKTELEEKGKKLGNEYFAANRQGLTQEADEKVAELARGEGAYAGKGLDKQIGSNTAAILYALRHGSEFGGVDYAGKIIFVAAYNPYGKLFTNKAEAEGFVNAHGGPFGPFGSESVFGNGEVHPGFDALQAEGNKLLQPVVTQFGGCEANVEPYFNPGGSKEVSRLKSLLNMTNTTITGGKLDGPDIHPSPAGYVRMAKLIVKACP
jgi:hypothetical protein